MIETAHRSSQFDGHSRHRQCGFDCAIPDQLTAMKHPFTDGWHLVYHFDSILKTILLPEKAGGTFPGPGDAGTGTSANWKTG